MALSAPPVFTVDLTVPPEERWVGALDLISAGSTFEESWLPAFAYHNSSLFNGLASDEWATLAAALTAAYPSQAAELHGLSCEFLRVYGQVVTFEYLAGWVYFHELAHSDLAIEAAVARPECTGLLVQDEVTEHKSTKLAASVFFFRAD
jgi:N-acylethanolamine-hydrolysing acid amidase